MLLSADHVNLLKRDIACDITFQEPLSLGISTRCLQPAWLTQIDQHLADGAAVGDVP